MFSVEKPQYLGSYWNTLWYIENPNVPSDRARLVTSGTGLGRLEHLAERIWDGFNNGNPFSVEKPQYLGFYWNTLGNVKNPNMPSDRARLFTPGNGLERLEHLSERVWDGFSRIWC